MANYKFFNDLTFYEDSSSGYFMNAKLKKRLHRYVWEFYNGEIPEDYHIHHIDGDKSNNDINNLKMLKSKEHLSYHSKKYCEENRKKVLENLKNNAIPKAIKWHKSDEGHKYHKEQYKKGLRNFTKNKVLRKCELCGSDFETINTKTGKFCSDKCKSKNRRLSGIDNEIRVCKFCGKEFSINKYSKTKTCSRSCAKSMYWDSVKTI